MFTTKKYTRPFLVAQLRSINARNYVNFTTFANALSPRAGKNSAQITALAAAVGGKTYLRGYFSGNGTVGVKNNLIAVVKKKSSFLP